MKSKTWLVLSIGFGTLLVLIALLGLGAVNRAQALHSETLAAHDAYLRADTVLREIPADLYLGGILIRDYLLDPDYQAVDAYQAQLLERRNLLQQQLDQLSRRFGDNEPARIQQLRTELHAYWDSMTPILEWSPEEKALNSRAFLRQQVLPRRQAVVALAREIGGINESNLRSEQQRLQQSQQAFRSFLERTLTLSLLFGFAVALISIARVASLERQSEQQRDRAETAEEELRRLSRNLVRTQEEERRSLSRELHDAIGQMLSAMTLELGNVEAALHAPDKIHERLEEARRLNAETIREVRDLAMGLRPAMLDELGLGPALRWQGREFLRRSGVPVTVQLDGDLEGLPESHRTAIYRIVQEALTNCARHAQAHSIRVSVYGRPDQVQLAIQDDGVGFEPGVSATRGLGLIGIQERVRELDGRLTVASRPQKGTILEVELPMRREVPAV
ncbi:MAG: sensor histidine kinase [Acidobacteria bacterium]|nr:sensor histidine kinase [Acidobacteriota bacterium]